MDYPGKVITKNQVTPTQTSATGIWTLDDAAAATRNNNWPVAGVPNPISKSLRFNTPDAAYLNRTPASASNRKTWTWSGWVKRSVIGSAVQQGLIGCSSGTTDSTFMNFQFTGDRLGLGLYTQYILLTTQLFRDVGAWYHIVVALDTTNATADNRCRMYINGVEVTVFTTRNNPTLNADYGINQATQHDIGRAEYTNSTCMGGYMTEINFIDGQQLTPSSFGMTDPITGVWEPLKYSGTYGTNGFYLNFKDATSTTTLGLDYSGNSNTWTTNNFSVTAGSGNDSLTDVPTPWIPYNTTGDVGGVVRGNYCTFNPLANPVHNTVSDGNLFVSRTSGGAAGNGSTLSTMGFSSGKFYWEIYVNANSGGLGSLGIGIVPITFLVTDWIGSSSASTGYWGNGQFFGNSTGGGTPPSYTAGDTIGIALNMDALTVAFYKNGVQAGGTITGLTGTMIPAICIFDNVTASFIANFGQRPFAYTPPSGFLSLCTTNLPASTILKGGDYFNTVLYTGNATTPRAITGYGFGPQFIVQSRRDVGYGLMYFDIVRGTSKRLTSASTAAEDTYGIVSSFDSDGFTMNVSDQGSNASGGTYVAWGWKAGGTGVSNTAGTITSTVSANTTSGFSIVTYTGTGSTASVGHGLNALPQMIIVKRRDSTGNWAVYHRTLGANTYLFLNSTAASASLSNYWQYTPSPGNPTSDWFGIIGGNDVNVSSATYVAYCFATVAGYSAFGSYTGNGSTDGPFVYLGFRPAFLMVKRTDTTGTWVIIDSKRNTYNPENLELYPNTTGAEGNGGTTYIEDFLSNGFKIRQTDTTWNGSGGTYIYAAFAENPFKNALAR